MKKQQPKNGPCSAVGSESDSSSRGRVFDSGRAHTFVEIDHEIISTVILLSLNQEGSFSVASESMCMKYWLIAL